METVAQADGCRRGKRSHVAWILMVAWLWMRASGLAATSDVQVVVSDPVSGVPPGAQVQVAGGVINHGPDGASNTVLTATLQDALSFVSGSSFPPGVTVEPDPGDPQKVLYDYGDVSSFSSSSFQLVIQVDEAADPGIYTIEFEVNSDSTDTVPDNNTSTAAVEVMEAPPGSLNENSQVTAGDPVGTFAGNYVEFEPADLNLGGPLPVFLERYYDSALFTDGVVQSALGHNWQHNWDITLAMAGTNATIAFRRGRKLTFQHDGTNWNQVFNTQVGFQLADLGAEFLLADPRSQLMYFFDADGLLTRIEDGRGNTNLLSYAGGLLTEVTDGLGRTLTFDYDGGNLLSSVTDGIRIVLYGHTGMNLTSFTDANGKVTTYTYDTANTNNPGLMTARTLPEGNAPYSQEFNDEGRVESQTDTAGGAMTFAYLREGGINSTTTTDALGNTMTHAYRPTGELALLTDEAGESVTVFIDAAGRRSQVRDRESRSTILLYDADSGLPTRINHPANNDDQFVYSSRTLNGVEFLDLERIVRPDGSLDRFEYDTAGNLVTYTNRAADIWTFENNARGQLLSSTNPTGGVASFTYDASARVASVTDTDVGLTTFEFDAMNRLTGVTNADDTSRSFAYDPLNRLTSATDERGNTAAFAYDDNSRLIGVTNALNQQTHLEYDGLNRLVRAVDRLGNAATFGYDPRTTPRSLLASVTNRNGFVTLLGYDERRRLTGVIDPGGRTNSFEYDAEGLLLAASNPLGETVRMRRDAMGYPTDFTDPLGNEVNLLRDQMKRVTRVTDPLGRIANYSYDPRGLLSSASREPEIQADYDYDGLGNLTRIIDPNNRFWQFTYTPMGRMSSSSDPISRTNFYTYDIRGRLSTVTYPDGATRTNTYDGVNNLTRVQFSDGTDFQYDYDALNRLTNATGSDPIEFEYDAMDRVINTRQVGVDFGASYDADGRLTSVTYPNPAGGKWTATYTYDSRDRLTGVSDDLTGTSFTFTYDDAHRLTGVTRPNGVNGIYSYDARGLITRIQEGTVLDLRYAYDDAGQVVEADFVTVPIDPTVAATTGSTNFFYDSASQITSTPGYAYNPRGNQSQIAGTNVGWDDALRVRSVGAVDYTYNALSDLETRVESGTTTRYFYNYAIGLNPIMGERDENTGQFARFYVWSPSGSLLYIINVTSTTISFPLFDRMGSTLALTDGAGVVSDAYAYNAYGRLLSQSGTNQQPFRFNGEFGIRADGPIYHMRARWYDPVTARFLSKEPVWPVLANPKKLNPYQFALRTPLTFYDADGRRECTPPSPPPKGRPNRFTPAQQPSKPLTEIERRIQLGGRWVDGRFVRNEPPTEGVIFKPWTGRSPWPKPRNQTLSPQTLGGPSQTTASVLFYEPGYGAFLQQSVDRTADSSGSSINDRDVDFSRPLILRFPEDLGRSSLAQVDFLDPLTAARQVSIVEEVSGGIDMLERDWLFENTASDSTTSTSQTGSPLSLAEITQKLVGLGLMSQAGDPAARPTFGPVSVTNLQIEQDGPAGDFLTVSGDVR